MSTFFAVNGITFGMTNEKVFGCRRLVLPMAVRGTDVHVLRTMGTVTLEPPHNSTLEFTQFALYSYITTSNCMMRYIYSCEQHASVLYDSLSSVAVAVAIGTRQLWAEKRWRSCNTFWFMVSQYLCRSCFLLAPFVPFYRSADWLRIP